MGHDRSGASNFATIFASCIIAGALVFAALYISSDLGQINRGVRRVVAATTQEQPADEPDDGAAEMDASIRVQFLDQVRRAAPAGMEFTEVSNIRFIQDDEVLTFDISYHAAPGGPV